MPEFHQPRKRFGQHFLADPTILQQIVHIIAPGPGQHLLEIGPGQGVLTLRLAGAVAQLDAVELDRDLIAPLQRACAAFGNVRIHQADALKFSPRSLLASADQPLRKLRVVGNLPYNISTPLLFHLFESIDIIEDMHFLLQKEVVDRICAAPGSGSYGRLSVMTQYYCHSSSMLVVPPQAFKPPPKVDSAVVRMIPHARPPVAVDDIAAFSAFVAQAFSARRKTLRNVLKAQLSREDFEQAQIDSQRRAETLSLQEFASLFQCHRGA